MICDLEEEDVVGESDPNGDDEPVDVIENPGKFVG